MRNRNSMVKKQVRHHLSQVTKTYATSDKPCQYHTSLTGFK